MDQPDVSEANTTAAAICCCKKKSSYDIKQYDKDRYTTDFSNVYKARQQVIHMELYTCSVSVMASKERKYD